MSNINWRRFIVGGIVAAIIAFFTDGFLHERVVGADWKAVYDNRGATAPEHSPLGLAYFGVFELGRGFLSMFLYVLMRAHCKPGPKTAALAGVAAWIAFSVTGPAQFMPLGFYSNALWLKVVSISHFNSRRCSGCRSLQRQRHTRCFERRLATRAANVAVASPCGQCAAIG